MKKKAPKSALLISTYNWPEALSLVLTSVVNQVEIPDEVLIADDGSTEQTAILIKEFQDQLPIRHIWHEDIGFRKAQILNKTIAATNAEYIIQVDGDCILHPHFIKDHINAIEKGCFLFGSRVNIKNNFLEKLFMGKVTSFSFFSGAIRNRTRNLHLPILGRLFKASTSFSRKFRGCNTSYFRTDFLMINGYNEDFEGWGREDSDLAYRFLNKGLKMKRLRYRGIVYHIPHKISSKNHLEENDAREKATIEQKLVRCKNGIDKYL